MNEQDLQLQAYFDGELSGAEARAVANRLAQDRDAVAMLQTLKATRQAMSTFEQGIKLPESREFYWSKIRRDIERLEARSSEPVHVSVVTRLRRMLVPISGVALLMVAGMIATRSGWSGGGSEVETALADTSAFTYKDYSEGTTLVWLSYPADQDSNDDYDTELN